MFYKYTKKQRRFIKIAKDIYHINSIKEIEQPFNTLAVGIRGSGKTTKLALMVVFSKVDSISSEYEEQNSCIVSNTNRQSQTLINTINNIIKIFEMEYKKRYNERLFYSVQNLKQPNIIYINNHQIRFMVDSITHTEEIQWKKIKDIYIDEFQLSISKLEDSILENLIKNGVINKYNIKTHLFGTDEGMRIIEAVRLFMSEEVPLKVEPMKLDYLSYTVGVDKKKNKIWNAVKKAISNVREFLLLK